ncbi:MAG TPA: rRNA maturation RNase YbeY [Methylomirabilota bacterium]|jgi:probable rRNA maturation factor
MPAVIANRQRRRPVSVRRLAGAVARALDAVGRPAGTVEVAVVDDAEVRRLNARYRGIARRTDVLAFPLEMPGAAGGLVGQIVVSADTAARQARRLRVPLALELDLLVTHGVLHLVGYDDRDPVEAVLMHRREREILSSAPERLWAGLLPRERQAATTRRARS